MKYILVVFLYSADCNLQEIRSLSCVPEDIVLSDIFYENLRDCRDHAESGQAVYDVLGDKKIRKWKVPHCETYSRALSMKRNASRGI